MDLELHRIIAFQHKANETLSSSVEALAHENEMLKLSVEALTHDNAKLRAALESCYKLHPYLEKGIGASDTPVNESTDK